MGSSSEPPPIALLQPLAANQCPLDLGKASLDAPLRVALQKGTRLP
jgi:hypothetical protein